MLWREIAEDVYDDEVCFLEEEIYVDGMQAHVERLTACERFKAWLSLQEIAMAQVITAVSAERLSIGIQAEHGRRSISRWPRRFGAL